MSRPIDLDDLEERCAVASTTGFLFNDGAFDGATFCLECLCHLIRELREQRKTSCDLFDALKAEQLESARLRNELEDFRAIAKQHVGNAIDPDHPLEFIWIATYASHLEHAVKLLQADNQRLKQEVALGKGSECSSSDTSQPL